MNTPSRRFFGTHIAWGAIAFLLLILSACNTLSSGPSRERLDNRINEYWTERKAGRWDRIYEMITAQEKQWTTKKQFVEARSLGGAKVERFEVSKVDLQKDRAVVTIKMYYAIQLPFEQMSNRQGESEFQQLWLFQDGDWRLRVAPENPQGNTPAK